MNTNIELWKKTKKGNRFWKVAACEKWNGAQVDEGSSKNKLRTLGGVLLLLRSWVWLTFNANGLWPLRNDRQQIREAVTRPGRIFSNIYRTILSLSPTRAEMKSQIPYLTAAEERKSKVIISFSCLPEENCPTNAGNGTLLLHKYCFALLTMMSSNTAASRMSSQLLHPSWSKICPSCPRRRSQMVHASFLTSAEDWYYNRMEVTFLLCGLFWQRAERWSRWLLFGKVLPSSHPHLALKCTTWESRWMPLLFVVSCLCWYVTAVVQKQSLLHPLFHETVYSARCNICIQNKACCLYNNFCTLSQISPYSCLSHLSIEPPNAISTQFRTFLWHNCPFILTRKCIMGSFPSVFSGYLYWAFG